MWNRWMILAALLPLTLPIGSRAEDRDVERLLREIKRLQEQVAEREQQVAQLKAQLKEAQLNERALRDRNVALTEQLAKLTKELARALAEKARDEPKPETPPDNVQGKVERVDAQAGLLTISIGADAGLKKGHRLQVYRFGDKPVYLGTITVVDVRPKEAVARLDKKPREDLAVKPGDQVASLLLNEK